MNIINNLVVQCILHKNWMQYIPVSYKNSVAFSLQENYTDWVTSTCWRILVLTFLDRGVSRGQHNGPPTVVNLSFLDRSCYFSFR
jgi:hypothetical protein